MMLVITVLNDTVNNVYEFDASAWNQYHYLFRMAHPDWEFIEDYKLPAGITIGWYRVGLQWYTPEGEPRESPPWVYGSRESSSGEGDAAVDLVEPSQEDPAQ